MLNTSQGRTLHQNELNQSSMSGESLKSDQVVYLFMINKESEHLGQYLTNSDYAILKVVLNQSKEEVL